MRATLLIGLIGTTLLPWGLGRVARLVATDSKPLPPPTMPYYTRVRRADPMPELMSLGLVPPWVLVRTTVPFGAYFQGGVWYYDPPWYEFDRGQSVTEVAQTLGIPEGTVKSRTYYAIRALREELANRGFPFPTPHPDERPSGGNQS